MSDPIVHTSTCSGGTPYPDRGRLGDNLLRCPGCPRFVVLAVRPPVATETPERVPGVVVLPLVAPASPWCCRDHLRPVSWKGTGCPECEDERRAREAAGRVRKARAERRTRAEVVPGVR